MTLHADSPDVETVAYIPARLGSERVPKKNLRHLGGRPLVTHVAETALQSSGLDRVYLNTESSEIAAAASPTGVDVYMRDPRLAAGPISTDEILYDFARATPCRTIVVINPSAPFLTVATIDRVVTVSKDSSPDATVFTTTRLHKRPRAGRRAPKTSSRSTISISSFLRSTARRS